MSRVPQIKQMLKEGVRVKEIAAELGVSTQRIYQIANRHGIPTHGQQASRLRTQHPEIYNRWSALGRRCKQEGRELPPEWSRSDDFIEWVLKTVPREGMVLAFSEEINPDTAEWITQRQAQARKAKQYTAFGETKSLREWQEDARCPVSLQCLRVRIEKYGWPIDTAIITPEYNLYGVGSK